MDANRNLLAIYRSSNVKTTLNFPIYQGGYEIGELEKQAMIEVINDKSSF